jgi:hypothetical protein
MKNTQNFKNQNNRTFRNVSMSMRSVPLALLMGVVAFGVGVANFFNQLVGYGSGPYSGLTTKQIKVMYWLRPMYHC